MVTDVDVQAESTQSMLLQLGLLSTGSECSTNTDCVFNVCDDNGFCSAPTKVCQSNDLIQP